jgi:AcrR family transcriptional regulator
VSRLTDGWVVPPPQQLAKKIFATLNAVQHLNGVDMGIAQRKAREKQELRRRILDAARELFVREGYENVSMRRIAQKIEYSPATIYTYFEHKDEILDSLCEETFRHLHEHKLAALQEMKGDALGVLKKGMEIYVRFGLEHPDHYIVTFILKAPPYEKPGGCETRKAKTGQQCFNDMRNAVRRCMEEGKMKNANLEETSQALWAGIHGLTALLITQPGFPFVERDRLIKRTIEILVRGASLECG